MRPLIVIGASDVMRTALEPYTQVGHIEHHPTTEAAHYALTDAHDSPDVLAWDDAANGWDAHVAYGPLFYGPLVVAGTAGRSARLPHTGRTLVLAWGVDHEPSRPRRMVEGRAAGEHPDTTVWQVGTAVSADHVVDLAMPVGVPFLIRLLEWKDAPCSS